MRGALYSGRVLAALLLGLSLMAGAGRCDDAATEPLSEKISSLVRQLAAPSFAGRETAARQLVEIGVPAKEALVAALKEPDAEVRSRARRVLAVVLQRDFQIRLSAFSADTTTDDGHGLAGWDRFRAAVGHDAAARQLFVDMQRSEYGLLDAADAGPQSAGEVLAARMRQLEEGRDFTPDVFDNQQNTAARVAALLFVASDPDVPLSEEAGIYVMSLINQDPLRQAAQSGPLTAPLRKLLGGWLRRHSAASHSMKIQNLMIAAQYQLPDGIDLALGLLPDRAVEPYLRPYPILYIAGFGKREHMPALAPLLEDADNCGESEDSEKFQCQVRDVALVALIHLSGQDPREYGFDRFQSIDIQSFDNSRLGFPSKAARKAALAKWAAWTRSPAGQSPIEP